VTLLAARVGGTSVSVRWRKPEEPKKGDKVHANRGSLAALNSVVLSYAATNVFSEGHS
jgi:hypothetical protein